MAGAVLAAALLLCVLAAVGSGDDDRGIAGGSRGTATGGRTLAKLRPRVPSPPLATTAGDRRAVEQVLSYTGAVSKGGDARRDVALTFDDGPGPDTARILATLRRLRAPATFFAMGRSMSTAAGTDALRRLGGPDYPIGDHTMFHPPLGRLGVAAQNQEIAGQLALLRRHGKGRPVMFRPPYGSFNATTIQILRREGMLMVLWTVDTQDFSSPGTKQIVDAAVSGARPGAIILMHDGPGGREQTLAALPRIVRRLREGGYRLVTVPKMMRENPPPRGQPPPQPLSGGF